MDYESSEMIGNLAIREEYGAAYDQSNYKLDLENR